MSEAHEILEVSGLSVDYVLDRGDVRAVDDVSFTVDRGEFLGIVGESGCGKSTLLFAVAQLLAPPAQIAAGSVRFEGTNLVGLTDKQLSAIRWRDMSVVMQSAMNALNPVKSIGAQFKDAMQAHGKPSKEEIATRSAEVLRMVGIDPVHLKSYPHQLSGGMRQRSMIAMAMLFTPDLIIMDEPTSALDVVAQRSLMMQIKELQQTYGFAVIFVTHDMSLISHFSDRLMVMYAGQVDELGATRTVFDRPLHPYTQGLLEAFPSIRGPKVPLKGIPGNPPDLAALPTGCRFHPRCPHAVERCARPRPTCTRWTETLVRCLRRQDGSLPRGRPGGEPEQMSELLRTEHLTRHFKIGGALSRRTLHAVDDVSFSIGEREIVALAGESGSGKSTIARLLARIYEPTQRADLLRGQAAVRDPLPARPAALQRPGADGVPGSVRLDQPGVPGPARRSAQPQAAPSRAVRRSSAWTRRPGCSRWSGWAPTCCSGSRTS